MLSLSHFPMKNTTIYVVNFQWFAQREIAIMQLPKRIDNGQINFYLTLKYCFVF